MELQLSVRWGTIAAYAIRAIFVVACVWWVMVVQRFAMAGDFLLGWVDIVALVLVLFGGILQVIAFNLEFTGRVG